MNQKQQLEKNLKLNNYVTFILLLVSFVALLWNWSSTQQYCAHNNLE